MKNEEKCLNKFFASDRLSEQDILWLAEYLTENDLSGLQTLCLAQYVADLGQSTDQLDDEKSKELLAKIHKKIGFNRRSNRIHVFSKGIKIAAMLVVTLLVGFYILMESPVDKRLAGQNTELINNIKPGKNKAVLILGNGTKVFLNDSTDRLVVQEGDISISQNKNGQVVYNFSSSSRPVNSSKIEYNVLSTPKAGNYQIILSDGTRVWLNAVSSIRFPNVFVGSKREIEITGEAYLEVAKNEKMPFRVISGSQIIEVHGTHFNINAYPNEKFIKTTLIEGSVKVTNRGKSVLLEPGQQSQAKENISVVDPYNIESEIAWKSGYFYFKDAGIETVMTQAARWYDLEIKYDGTIPFKQLNGRISRNVDASKFLEMLEYSGLKFKIDGRKITINQ